MGRCAEGRRPGGGGRLLIILAHPKSGAGGRRSERLNAMRLAAGAVVAAVTAGLPGADYHWLSDVLAGGLLGAAVGRGVAALMPGG